MNSRYWALCLVLVFAASGCGEDKEEKKGPEGLAKMMGKTFADKMRNTSMTVRKEPNLNCAAIDLKALSAVTGGAFEDTSGKFREPTHCRFTDPKTNWSITADAKIYRKFPPPVYPGMPGKWVEEHGFHRLVPTPITVQRPLTMYGGGLHYGDAGGVTLMINGPSLGAGLGSGKTAEQTIAEFNATIGPLVLAVGKEFKKALQGTKPGTKTLPSINEIEKMKPGLVAQAMARNAAQVVDCTALDLTALNAAAGETFRHKPDRKPKADRCTLQSASIVVDIRRKFMRDKSALERVTGGVVNGKVVRPIWEHTDTYDQAVTHMANVGITNAKIRYRNGNGVNVTIKPVLSTLKITGTGLDFSGMTARNVKLLPGVRTALTPIMGL